MVQRLIYLLPVLGLIGCSRYQYKTYYTTTGQTAQQKIYRSAKLQKRKSLEYRFRFVPHDTGYSYKVGKVATGTEGDKRFYQFDDSIRVYFRASNEPLNEMFASEALNPYILYGGKPTLGHPMSRTDTAGNDLTAKRTRYNNWSDYWLYNDLLERRKLHGFGGRKRHFELYANPGDEVGCYCYKIGLLEIYNPRGHVWYSHKRFLKGARVSYFSYFGSTI